MPLVNDSFSFPNRLPTHSLNLRTPFALMTFLDNSLGNFFGNIVDISICTD